MSEQQEPTDLSHEKLAEVVEAMIKLIPSGIPISKVFDIGFGIVEVAASHGVDILPAPIKHVANIMFGEHKEASLLAAMTHRFVENRVQHLAGFEKNWSLYYLPKDESLLARMWASMKEEGSAKAVSIVTGMFVKFATMMTDEEREMFREEMRAVIGLDFDPSDFPN